MIAICNSFDVNKLTLFLKYPNLFSFIYPYFDTKKALDFSRITNNINFSYINTISTIQH